MIQNVLKKVTCLHGGFVFIYKGIMCPQACTVHSGWLVPPDFTLPHPTELFMGTMRPNQQRSEKNYLETFMFSFQNYQVNVQSIKFEFM